MQIGLKTMAQDILVERSSNGVAVVTLNRATKRNAISFAMWRELKTIFDDFNASADIRAAILTGAGGNFSSGADIAEFATLRASVDGGTIYEKVEEDALRAVLDCNKPTIAQISGFTIGGACALACACDFRIADKSASFFVPAARLGIVYSCLETELLLYQVGLANAKLILLSGERISAEEAARLGLVNQLTDGDVAEAARHFAGRFLSSAPISLAGNKFILNTLARGERDKYHAEIDGWIHRSMESDDYKEGQRAFREKRAPLFTGR